MRLKLIGLTALAAFATAAPAAAGDESEATAAAVLPTPKPGMGQVVFFRPSGMGTAVKCTIREGGRMVGRVGNNRYYVIDVAPGAHSYTAKSESTDTVNVQVEPDETSFVKCKISMGVMVGRPNLSPATADDWAKASVKIKPMEADKIAAEIAKDSSKQDQQGASE